LKEIARVEFSIMRMKELLGDVIASTQNQVRKKLSRNPNERNYDMEAEAVEESSSDDEEEKQNMNKKNLPIGADGKPIPLWLYKLHGLGIEFKCEICGGASYWGRRAYERHFQEWRHVYGMKCLKIPNTGHFRDVTKIEDALKLHKKILKDNFENTFKPDLQEEFEDAEGNLYSRKEYIDLKRQGLI